MKRIWSSLLTVVLATVIIAGGIVGPSLIYPWLDPFMSRVTQLSAPEDDNRDRGLLPPLYPWNIYDIRDTRPLTYEERRLLVEKGVPEFLQAAMADRGMLIDEDAASTSDRILAGFAYLSPISENYPECFVLADFDLDLDSDPDFRCAVDLDGDIITFLVLNNAWASLDLTPDVPLSDPPVDSLEPEGLIEGDVDQPDDDYIEADADEDDPGIGDDATAPGDEDTTDALDDIDEPEIPVIDREPLPEDLTIWSFSYSVNRAARQVSQASLAWGFRQIDLNFCYRNNYSFEYYLWIKNGLMPEPDDLAYTSNMYLNPIVYSYENYDLYIYDLTQSDTRIILYVDPRLSRCMGFTIW